jgi:methyltransferase (TIGR00027 family)
MAAAGSRPSAGAATAAARKERREKELCIGRLCLRRVGRVRQTVAVQEHKASATAAGVALLRVLHQKLDALPRILHDAVSEKLLDPRAVRWALDHPDRFQSAGSRGLRLHVVVRSRYSEDALAEAVARGVRQLVVLGAGLDTFAYRQPPWGKDLRIFEVDHPASQALKRDRLAAAGVALPDNLTYAPVNFEVESLRDGLSRAGLDVTQPTFFSCLGVLMYLTEAATDDLFSFLGGFPPGSELVLTFSPEGERSEAHRRLERLVAEVGEPMQSHVSEEALAAQLQRVGFHQVHFVAPVEIADRYLQGRADGLQPPRRTTLARARI